MCYQGVFQGGFQGIWARSLRPWPCSAPKPHSLAHALPPQVNYNLLAVNAFMAVTGLYQLQRKIRHDMEQGSSGQQEAQPAA